MPYVYFSGEQKLRANSVDLEEYLSRRGEKLIRAGPEKRLTSDHSITVRGNEWFDHAIGVERGGQAISFMMYHYDMSYVEAVTELLGGEQGQGYPEAAPKEEKERVPFELPQKGGSMKRTYSSKGNRRPEEEYGSAQWGSPKDLGRKYRDAKHPAKNLIFTDKVQMGMDGRKHRRNLNVMVVGGSGAGKTRFYCKPPAFTSLLLLYCM